MTSIIIDTDPGCDDALAIMLAVKSKLDIKAITTVAGNTNIENTTKNARYILKFLEREDIPIYSGAEKPLFGKLIKAEVQGENGLGEVNPDIESILTNDAVERIISIIEDNPDITIVAIGPLTNIASAIIKCPETMKKVKKIIIMGGAINVEGNKNRVAEFNLFVDPEAAKIVFEFPIKKVLVPLDICIKVPVFYEEFENIQELKTKELVLKMMRPYIEGTFKYDSDIKAAFMYDPLTIYYLINPESYKLVPMDIKIETTGEFTRGMTVQERRIRIKKEYNVEVVNEINAKKFKMDFINILSNLTSENIKNLEGGVIS